MTTIGAIGGASSAWSCMAAARGKMQEKMFEKVDVDASGGIDTTELQGLLDDVAKKTGVSGSTDAGELLAKLDGNGDGSLNSDELAEGMRSILPPPSTMEFAQSRGQDDSDMFTKLDSDGDGSLSQAEFDAGRPSEPPMGGPGGMRPPPPPGDASSSSADYDPLDANEDGTVTAAERAAGAGSTEAVQALFKAIDTDGDGSVSQSEGDAFVQQLNSAYEAATTSASSASSADGDTASPEIDLAKMLASLMLRQYDQIASGGLAQASASTLSLVA